MNYISKIIESYNSTVRLYCIKLIVAEETIFVKGLNKSEIELNEASVLKGILQITVNREVIPITSIKIGFIGQSIDVLFTKTPQNRRLINMNGKVTVNDCYKYTMNDLLRGIYEFPFQFSIDPNTPETISSILGSNLYQLEVLIRDDLKRETYKPILKEITIVRIPGENSLLINDCVSSVGNWKNQILYNICIHSKVLKLNDSFRLSLSVTKLNQFDKLKYTKVYLIQKLRCSSNEFTSNYANYVSTQKQLIFYESFNKNEELIEKSWEVSLPKEMRFKVYPYNSNNEFEVGMKINHFLSITIGIETNNTKNSSQSQNKDKIKFTEQFNEITFKTPIYLLNSIVDIYSSLPLYSNSISNESTKSSTWLCTNGKYEHEMPPKY